MGIRTPFWESCIVIVINSAEKLYITHIKIQDIDSTD